MTQNNDLSPKAQALFAFLQENGYICPWGSGWDKLWKMLPNKTQYGGGKPAPPLILAGWYASNNLEKILRMKEHIEWADTHGVFDKVDKYLRGLDLGAWYK